MGCRLKLLLAALLYVPALPAAPAEFAVDLEVPQMHVAEYHRPYVAVWVEDARRTQVLQIALWLEQEKWHRDLRSWWRRGGRSLALPVDGVSGATRRPGSYTVRASHDLPAGEYTLNIEAVREVGGREHLRLPFTWSGRSLAGEAAGETELGVVRYTIEEND
jgi:hypothetical protein